MSQNEKFTQGEDVERTMTEEERQLTEEMFELLYEECGVPSSAVSGVHASKTAGFVRVRHEDGDFADEQ